MSPKKLQALALKREDPTRSKAAVARLMGNTPQAVYNMASDYEWNSQWEEIETGETEALIVAEGVPDFLTWRTMHCAYLNGMTKKVKRAQNFWYQKDWIERMQTSNRLIMVLHPGAGKTTGIVEYITWQIMRDRNFRCTVIRANEDEAKKNVRTIALRLSDSEYYDWLIDRMQLQDDKPIIDPVKAYGGKNGFITEKGGKISEQWSASAFTVSGRTSGDKEPTVQAFGMGSPLAGNRADLIVLDDAQDPQKYRTTGLPHTEKMFSWFREDVLPRLYDHQKLVVIGNRLGSQDFVGRLISEYGEDWTVVYYPAVLQEDSRRVLVPELWTYDALQRKRKEVGETIWAFQWQQQDIDDSDATFTRDQVELCRDPDLALGDAPKGTVILGIDPAIVNYCAMVVWSINPATGVRTLVDFVNEKAMKSEDNIAQRAAELCRMYSVKTCVVETNNIQATIFGKIKSHIAPMGVRCIQYKTVTSYGGAAEASDFDISSIGTLFQERLVKLPYAGLDTQKRMGPFIEQFLLWRPRPPGRTSWHLTRDLVMATLFAESEARKVIKSADRPKTKRESRAPKWAQNSEGGWGWRERRRQSA